MENLETPYDEETEFVECTVCEKSLRGETLYKIHLTTPGHIKLQKSCTHMAHKRAQELEQLVHYLQGQEVPNSSTGPDVSLGKTLNQKWFLKEDSIVAAGRAVRKHIVPEFKDIVQYLDYLKLDEPIIGLSFLDEVPCNDPQAGPRYLCRLCHHTANLADMLHHVIGRKHRQKYVELKRPDLVTWDKQSIITQGGKIIRARAEIIERQDGRGSPLALVKRGSEGKLNISRVPPREKQNRNRNIPQRSSQHNVPPLLPEFNDEYSNRVKPPIGYPNTPSFHPDEPDLNRGRHMYQRDDPLRLNYMEEELHWADYRENDMYRREYMDSDNCRKNFEDPHNLSSPRAVLEPGSVPMYDSREEMSHGEAQHLEYYPDKAPPNRRPYPENDPLKEFYSEEVRRRQSRSAEYQPSQRVYQDDEHQWSLERESRRRDSMIRSARQASSEPEAKRGSIPIHVESDQSQDHLFNVIRDYRRERRETHQVDAMSSPGPSTSHRQVTRTMSDIPEPFRRFLKGDNGDEGQSKRKRKSRFSDATAEEVEMTKEMFSDEYGPPNPKFGGCPRPEIHGTQHLDHYRASQSPQHTESYQKGGFGTEGVFDMLKNIEIENAEEADFLKNKLCSLLKEFKSRKSEKDVQNIQGQAFTNNYNSLKSDHDAMSPPYHYKRSHREDSDLRRPEVYFKEDHSGRGWKERHIEYHDPTAGEPRYSNRSRHEDPLRWSEMSETLQPDEPHYPEIFQEPVHPYVSQPSAEKHFDFHSSATPLHMDRESRMHKDSRYSKNLDKITSTLLELVARK